MLNSAFRVKYPIAVVLKLVDKHVSEACGAIHGGSTPLGGTNSITNYELN